MGEQKMSKKTETRDTDQTQVRYVIEGAGGKQEVSPDRFIELCKKHWGIREKR